MTDREALRAFVALEDRLRNGLVNDPVNGKGLRGSAMNYDVVETIVAALPLVKTMIDKPVAEGGCKMAWAQGFCYGDPEYYPPSPPVTAAVESVVERVARALYVADRKDPGEMPWEKILGYNPILANEFRSQARAALAAAPPAAVVEDTRQCTCHPDDNPPKPCPKKYALSDCRAAAILALTDRVRELEAELAEAENHALSIRDEYALYRVANPHMKEK